MQHALERTSEKGQKFIGKCISCGKDDLTIHDIFIEECHGNKTQEEIILEAIEGTNEPY